MTLGYGLQNRGEIPGRMQTHFGAFTVRARAALHLHRAALTGVVHSPQIAGLVALHAREYGVVTDNTVSGYRSVRALGETSRARLVLVQKFRRQHASLQPDPERTDAAATARDNDLRALKCFESGASSLHILTEIECVSRASGEHVVAADDVAASSDDSPILVLRWTAIGTLRRLLRDRHSLRLGEAITIIAPLVSALNRVHNSGVTIGEITVDAVQFDETGYPFFSEFSAARLKPTVQTPAERQLDDSFREDRRQLAGLANSVLAAVQADRDGSRSVNALSAWLSDDANTATDDWHQILEQQIFSLGAPEPLRLTADAAGGTTETANVLRPYLLPNQPAAALATSETRSVLALPPWVDARTTEIVLQISHTLARLRRSIVSGLRPVRLRTWILAGVGTVCVVVALVIVAVDSPAVPSPPASTGLIGEAAKDDGADSMASPPAAANGEPASPLPGDAQQALVVLLDTRAACIRDLSVACLETVSSVGTPAYTADAAAIDQMIAGGELPSGALFEANASVEKQQLGDSVLFEFTGGHTSKPASVLLVKGEAGWRIRSYTLPE